MSRQDAGSVQGAGMQQWELLEGQIQPSSAAGQGWDGGPTAMVGSTGSQNRAGAPWDGFGELGSPSSLGPEAKVGLAGSSWDCPGLIP